MKPTNFTLLLILIIHQISFGQWEEKNISTTSTLSSVHFLDDENGFVAGGNKIFKTIDGGDTWETSFTGSDLVFFEDVLIIEENNIIAVGQDFDSFQSVIVKTIDNGINWDIVNILNTSFLKSIFFTSSTTGYCSGGGGIILKSTDSGDTWQVLDSGTGTDLQSIYFVNDLVGIAVGGSPVSSIILKTQNGGSSWSPISSPSNNNLQSAFFINDQIGYVVGWNGEIIKTEDCGNSWTTQNSVDMVGNLEVIFTDENTGYIVGGQMNESLIQKTVNGGDLWEDVSPNISAGLVSIYFSSFEVGYAVGANGAVVKTESGGVMTSNNNLFSNTAILLFPNPTLDIVSIESSENDIIKLISFYDNNGKLMSVKKGNLTKMEFDLSRYPSGIYYVALNTENGKSIRKLVKK
jgi:photosystem II stability/assembly factor-like uncharacterized protein